jgi:hypothetical protein
MAGSSGISEADILADVIAPQRGDLPAEAARAMLKWKFSASASRKMKRLLDRNRAGQLAPNEEEALAKFVRVGLLVDLLQAKARLSLGRTASSP